MPLRSVVEASLLLTASRRKPKEVPVDLPDFRQGLAVVGEKVRGEQILVNLLSNAFEAQDPGTNPWVRLGISADVDCVTLTVTDNELQLTPQAQLFGPSPPASHRASGWGWSFPAKSPPSGRGSDGDNPVPGQGATFRLC